MAVKPICSDRERKNLLVEEVKSTRVPTQEDTPGRTTSVKSEPRVNLTTGERSTDRRRELVKLRFLQTYYVAARGCNGIPNCMSFSRITKPTDVPYEN